MLVIGLAGGIACGKSLVASYFSDLGCTIIDADKVGHEVLRQPKVIEQIQQQFGDEIVVAGEVDRRKLAKIVFPIGDHPPTIALRQLEQIVHPEIGIAIDKRLEQICSTDVKAVVLDAPVMFKAGWDRFCDRIVFIESDVEIRRKRSKERGWSTTELERRESFQTPLEVKRQRSTDVITNSGTPEELKIQIEQLWRQWNLPA